MNQITSDVSLIDLEQHFRVSAGPGAGKTHWLVEHIKNVLNRSERLSKTRKIACITYTNIAVETILARLGTSAERVEVSTIHSFLYRYVVKPYVSFVSDEYGLNVAEMDGHDEVILSGYSFLNDWKTKTQQQRVRNNNEIVMAITKAKWSFDKNTLIFKPNYPAKVDGYALKNSSYLKYKEMAWEKGILHHDDVLFFSYKIIEKYSFVLKVLQQQFPYFFVDEFQDTNPIQTAILNKIGQNETVIGIIGDKAQSIYGFQGAKLEQFSSFSLPNIVGYQMAENRRSTNQIIKLLNSIRKDIKQESSKNENGEQPVIIVGEMNLAFQTAIELCENQPVYSLSRDNITSNVMKKETNLDAPEKNLFPMLYSTDSNRERRNLIIACIKSLELAREFKYKDAIKELERIFRDEDDKEKGKKEALKHLQILLKNYDGFKSDSLFRFYEIVKSEIKSDISKLGTGKIKDFYDNHHYQELAVCVKIAEDKSFHKTIHKAKGDEFDNVLLVLKEEEHLEFLTNPDLTSNKEKGEEHRINYVAVSRAKKRLFISVPSISEIKKINLMAKNIVSVLPIEK